MIEDLLTEPENIATISLGAVAGAANIQTWRKLYDGWSAHSNNKYGSEKDEMRNLLENSEPDEEEIYEMMGEDGEITDPVEGCYIHWISEKHRFEGRRDAIVEYSEEKSSEEGDNWDWLAKRAADLEYNNFTDLWNNN